MKREPAPSGEPSPFEKFDAALRRIVSVPKAELDRREAAYKRQRAAKRRRKTSR